MNRGCNKERLQSLRWFKTARPEIDGVETMNASDAIAMAGVGTFLVALVAAAVCDLVSREIPDGISIGLIVVALAVMVVTGASWSTVARQIGVATALFALGALAFAARQWGGGDAKLFAATGFWFEPPDLLTYFLVVAIAGGLLALVVLGLRRRRPAGAWVPRWLGRLADPDEGVPYGVALAVGGIAGVDRAFAAVAGGAGVWGDRGLWSGLGFGG